MFFMVSCSDTMSRNPLVMVKNWDGKVARKWREEEYIAVAREDRFRTREIHIMHAGY